jgi:hypothetical protein
MHFEFSIFVMNEGHLSVLTKQDGETIINVYHAKAMERLKKELEELEKQFEEL